MRSIFQSIKYFLYFPFLLPAILVYFTRAKEESSKIKLDILTYWKRTGGGNKTKFNWLKWYKLLISNKEFRNVFYSRCGFWRNILSIFLKPVPSLFINPTLCKNYEGGLYIAHGTSSQIYANKIGKNLWMHHNITIGMIGEGRPEIGDNVYIGTGAVILGNVKIGNNVRIGANATIVKDVPDNCTVVSPQAYIVKRDGKRVHEKL